MDTLHATQRKSNLTMAMLQDNPTFDGQEPPKLEDWFIDIETAADILTESHIHLAEAQITWPQPHALSMRPLKQETAWMRLRASLD